METYEPVTPDLLKITEYELLGKLPDPFVMDDGTRITDPKDWEKRREEIYRYAIELQYGVQPPAPEFLEVEPLYFSEGVHGYKIHTGTYEKPVSFRMQVLIPKTEGEKFPFIIDGDQCWRYHMNPEYLNAALDRGIGWVFFDRTELAHDISFVGRGKGALYETYPDLDFGALSAWAWGYSRCVDALEKLPLPVDHDWLVFVGHSRGAKTAALAGALDRRARIVNPNETCAGACGCYRIHMKGYCGNNAPLPSETLKDLWNHFDFWMGPGMGAYCDRENELPFDTHFLKAMIAPRTLFVSEAAGDLWANPVGSWQTTMAAAEVFKFLGAEKELFWYFRPGTHGHSVTDVEMLVNVIENRRDQKPVDPRMFRLPFTPPEKAFDWESPN